MARPRPAAATRACGRARLAAAVEAERRAQAGRLDALTWYALAVVSRREFEAVADLARRGLFAWTPTRTVWRHPNQVARAKGRKRATTFAAAPGLALLGAAGPVRWDAALSASGVIGVLGAGGAPRALDAGAVAWAMRRSSTAPAVERFMRSRREFAVGDVVATDAGLRGRVIAIEGRHARLLAALLGAEREVKCELGALALAS